MYPPFFFYNVCYDICCLSVSLLKPLSSPLRIYFCWLLKSVIYYHSIHFIQCLTSRFFYSIKRFSSTVRLQQCFSNCWGFFISGNHSLTYRACNRITVLGTVYFFMFWWFGKHQNHFKYTICCICNTAKSLWIVLLLRCGKQIMLLLLIRTLCESKWILCIGLTYHYDFIMSNKKKKSTQMVHMN